MRRLAKKEDIDMSVQISPFKATLLAGGTGLAVAALIAIAGITLTSQQVTAKPQYASQTGKACTYCHTPAPPKLNAKGKAFKAKGHKL
jgi:hypothetical protein